MMIYTQPLVLEQNCPPFSGKRLRGGRISTPTTVTRSLARTQKEEFASILNSNDGDIKALFKSLENFTKN